MYGDVRGVIRTLTIFALVLWATTGLASAQGAVVERPLVLPFSVDVEGEVPGGEGAAFWLGEAAALLIAEELEARGIAVLSRAERVAAFGLLQLPPTSRLTRATMIRVGELVGATELVVGEVRLGARLSVTARIITLDTARERARATGEGLSTGIYDVVEQVTSQLLPVQPDATHADARMPLAAFESYVKGLVATTPAVQERFLEGARQQDPDDERVLLAISEFYAGQGAHDKALVAARAVRTEARQYRQAQYAVARALMELHRYDEAYALLHTLQADEPSPVLLNAIGVIQMRRGSTPQTGLPTHFFAQAVERAPEETDFLFNLGYGYARSRNPKEALPWLREVVRFNPAAADAHLLMSQMLTAEGRNVEASRELALARQLGPSVDPDDLTDRVPAGLERVPQRLDDRPSLRIAEAIANPGQREQQELAAFHLARGRRLFELDDDRGAMDELRRAIYLRPYDDEPHLLLGRIYQRAGRLTEAINAFRIAVWSRASVDAHLRLAEALYENGESADAIGEARRAVALDPQSVEARAVLARMGGDECAHGVRSQGTHD